MRQILTAIAVCLSLPAFAHDHNRPDLDQWYRSLERPDRVGQYSGAGGTSCCNLRDCHETEAEYRGSEVWARLGYRKDGAWILLNWMRVPEQKILKKKHNPTGSPVICHTLSWKKNMKEMETGPGGVEIYCFIDADQT